MGPASWRIRCHSWGGRSLASCSISHDWPMYWSTFGRPGLSREA
ncbi:hypothetical protein AvCA_03340 [Azotobacter vinelandii CA]|uniref:Uncharacterized protein n=2 Tax=Azotobacter vinelandii TaxID=354 RepID=C1DI97_AZOVD|nr:hypothetical protein Avin_03340 [Azotobacter vinelandii DJ]AGK17348.1 hypothetical protein AvCA_03340 [Azotobacter vinelandii CA]AGK19222.1 hypothetical protein AvCA6_03340 [Azotobacter vinelandii CA6]